MKTSSLNFALVIFVAAGLPISTSYAQEKSASTSSKCPMVSSFYDPVEYGETGPEGCKWERPKNVRFLTLRGCGAGGGGAELREPNQYQFYIGAPGGSSGGVESLVIGPLEQDEYRIVVPGGGKPTEAGGATSFVGGDVSVAFSGGRPGLGEGRDSRYAKGGTSQERAPKMGGDAGLGRGGDTQKAYKQHVPYNVTAGGICAGGGGGIVLGRINMPAAAGGPGSLLVLPHVSNLGLGKNEDQRNEVKRD